MLVNPNLYFGILKNGPGNIRKLKQAGVNIGIGTDAGVPFVYHGMIWREMEIFKRMGFSNREILQCATINNAKILKTEDKIGSIEEGKLADLVVLAKNPLHDIKACRKPLMTMLYGKIRYMRNENPQKIMNTVAL